MNMEVNWGEYYKAVDARLGKAQVSAPRVVLAVPRAPSQEMAKPVVRYAHAIGPTIGSLGIDTGYITYAGGRNAISRAWHTGKRNRGPHPLDARPYPRPIGPHECPFPGLGRVVRDWLIVSSVKTRTTPVKQIIREVCEEYHVSELDVLSPRRLGALTRPRQKICYRLRHETLLSLPGMGRVMKRDHTTILHSIRKATALIKAGEMTAPIPVTACVEG